MQTENINPVVEACEGCGRIVEREDGLYCQASNFPQIKWRLGLCNLATHVKEAVESNTAKINPLKASKRAAGG